eukprot:GHRQ01017488.1.p4 GENE.GHRQ01017488.1~~GHRQ01017488.1.p4  ORF type:complete len:116 (+),score=56.18 GHRQ01017488.1:532-879(+)
MRVGRQHAGRAVHQDPSALLFSALLPLLLVLLLQVLINNAGMAKESFKDGLPDLTGSTLADTLTVNAFAPLLVVQQLLKQGLLGGSSPSLVAYTSSIMASMGGYAFPNARVYAYR